jgi:hypothetical protein
MSTAIHGQPACFKLPPVLFLRSLHNLVREPNPALHGARNPDVLKYIPGAAIRAP